MMPGLEATIGKLLNSRRRWESLMTLGLLSGDQAGPGSDELEEIAAFGPNPGDLRMLVHVAKDLPPGAPLVVVAHGCTQNAAGYAHGAGWVEMAARHGFALLAPEQKRANNTNLCFNWYQPDDVRRDRGEVASVRQMVAWMVATHGLDARRVFVTGLSAGGAMTAALLATYPDVFAAGAIIAGLPYGCAGNTQEALDCMFHEHVRPAGEWGDLVRKASSHGGPWPHVAVWHGSADTTVIPVNAAESVKQWTDVHGLAPEPSLEDTVDGCVHRVWRGPDGAPLVSSFMVPGLAHGTPIDAASADPTRNYGKAAPHILDVGVASSVHIAASWGLIGQAPTGSASPKAARSADPASVIARTLRSVGLLGAAPR